MAHTPAPWTVMSLINCTAVVSGKQVVATVGPTADDELPLDQDECSTLFAQANADAALIAAAPELFEALLNMLQIAEGVRENTTNNSVRQFQQMHIDAARAVLAKAGGAA